MQRIEALTFFRFLAALTVVFFHFGRNLPGPEPFQRFLTLGPEMVTFFFALSGFVMMIASARKPEQTARHYYGQRIARIYPVYLVALIWAVVLFFGQKFSNGYGVNNATALFLNLTLLQSWFPPYPLSINDPAWSLSVEAFFYLSFPMVLFLIRKSQVSLKKLMIGSVLLYLFTQAVWSGLFSPRFYAGFPTVSHDLMFYFPLFHYCSFFFGVVAGQIYITHPERFHQRGLMPFAGFLFLLVVTVASLLLQPETASLLNIYPAFDASFHSLVFVLFILAVAWSDNLVTRLFSWRPLVMLGNASYALYILQKPAFVMYQRHLSKFLQEHVTTSPGLLFGIFILLLVGLSLLAFYSVEKPGQRLLRRWLKT